MKVNSHCIYFTNNHHQAYKMLSEMETQTADDRANNQHERALQEFFVRTQPIGELKGVCVMLSWL